MVYGDRGNYKDRSLLAEELPDLFVVLFVGVSLFPLCCIFFAYS